MLKAPQEHIELNFEGPIQGSGWYEKAQGESYRWSGPGTRSELDLQIETRHDYQILIHIFGSITPDQLNSLKLYANGTKILLTKVAGNKRNGVFRGIILRKVIQKNPSLTRLTFEIDQTVQPEPQGTEPDTRRLGLAFGKLTLSPVDLST